jgi:hypothetical protein
VTDRQFSGILTIMKLSLLSVLIFLPGLLKGQTFKFPQNNEGKVEYYHYLPADSVPEANKKSNSYNLYHSIINAPYHAENADQFEELTGNFTKMTGFILYEKGLITKKPASVIIAFYKVTILDSGFQVFISGLKYSELVRDRYGNYNPPGSKFFPIESIISHNHGKKWDLKYREIDDKILGIISDSQLFLLKHP